jgi:hypothetical protein
MMTTTTMADLRSISKKMSGLGLGFTMAFGLIMRMTSTIGTITTTTVTTIMAMGIATMGMVAMTEAVTAMRIGEAEAIAGVGEEAAADMAAVTEDDV